MKFVQFVAEKPDLTFTVDESLRQYLRMRALARRVAPDLEHLFAEQRKTYYVQWHEWLERAARGMGRGSA